MPVYAFGDAEPSVDPSAYVHPDAIVIGDVVIGPESSVWPQAVIRADVGQVLIGARTSVQDGAVVVSGDDGSTVVGDDCVIAHLSSLSSCVVEDGSLVGSRAVVLDGAVVRSGAFVAAGAVVPESSEVPSGALAVGVPATLRPGAASAELIERNAARYVARTRRYPSDLRLV